MFKTILIILLLTLSVLLGNQLRHDPGYVYITINHYTLETTVWFAVLLLFFIWGLTTLVYRLIVNIIRSPHTIKTWWREYKLTQKQRLSREARETLRQSAFRTTQRQLIADEKTQDLDAFMKQLPRAYRHDPSFIVPYCQSLITRQQQKKAEEILRSELKRHIHDETLQLYGRLDANPAQLEFAESLLKNNPESAALMLALGRLCIHHHLWGKAIHYLEQSIHIAPTQDVYVELGKLYEQLNREEEACEMYKQGLAQQRADAPQNYTSPATL